MRFWRIELVTLFHGWFSAPVQVREPLTNGLAPLVEAILIGQALIASLIFIFRWTHGGF